MLRNKHQHQHQLVQDTKCETVSFLAREKWRLHSFLLAVCCRVTLNTIHTAVPF